MGRTLYIGYFCRKRCQVITFTILPYTSSSVIYLHIQKLFFISALRDDGNAVLHCSVWCFASPRSAGIAYMGSCVGFTYRTPEISHNWRIDRTSKCLQSVISVTDSLFHEFTGLYPLQCYLYNLLNSTTGYFLRQSYILLSKLSKLSFSESLYT